jgi:hypothetical protein
MHGGWFFVPCSWLKAVVSDQPIVHEGAEFELRDEDYLEIPILSGLNLGGANPLRSYRGIMSLAQ